MKALRHGLTRYVLRHRHRFACWWPRVDDSGLWLTVTWLWWTRDFFPDAIGKRFVKQADDMRKDNRDDDRGIGA